MDHFGPVQLSSADLSPLDDVVHACSYLVTQPSAALQLECATDLPRTAVVVPDACLPPEFQHIRSEALVAAPDIFLSFSQAVASSRQRAMLPACAAPHPSISRPPGSMILPVLHASGSCLDGSSLGGSGVSTLAPHAPASVWHSKGETMQALCSHVYVQPSHCVSLKLALNTPFTGALRTQHLPASIMLRAVDHIAQPRQMRFDASTEY